MYALHRLKCELNTNTCIDPPAVLLIFLDFWTVVMSILNKCIKKIYIMVTYNSKHCKAFDKLFYAPKQLQHRKFQFCIYCTEFAPKTLARYLSQIIKKNQHKFSHDEMLLTYCIWLLGQLLIVPWDLFNENNMTK